MLNLLSASTFAVTLVRNKRRTVRLAILLTAVVLVFANGPVASGQGGSRQTADVVGQSAAGAVVSENGATAIRTPQGITVSVSMPTPAPFSHTYPPPNAFQPAVYQGAPEVFTGWAFVFNYPALCSAPCDSNDLGPTRPAKGGVHNFAGHVVGGSHLQLDGHISVGEAPFGGVALENPSGAEVHLAVAPHGTLQPDLMPTQINYPIGNPMLWWVAFLLP